MRRVKSEVDRVVHVSCAEVSWVVCEPMLVDSCHGVCLLLLHSQGDQLLVQTYKSIIALRRLLVHFSQPSLHARVFIFDLVKFDL